MKLETFTGNALLVKLGEKEIILSTRDYGKSLELFCTKGTIKAFTQHCASKKLCFSQTIEGEKIVIR